jgi:hypothetical protein
MRSLPSSSPKSSTRDLVRAHTRNRFLLAAATHNLLRATAQSEYVRKTLDDQRVRDLCGEIVEGGERRLKQALKDEDFAAFMDEVLKVIGVRDDEGQFIL